MSSKDISQLPSSTAFIMGLAAGCVISLGALKVKSLLDSSAKSSKQWDYSKPKESILELIGHTPMLRLASLSEALGNEVFLKLENNNPSRSNKDRAAKHILTRIVNSIGQREGLLSAYSEVSSDQELANLARKLEKNKYSIYEGTSGNTGISLGLLSNYFGLNARIFLNDDLASEKYNSLEAAGCQLQKVRNVSFIEKTHFVRSAKNVAEKDPNGFLADQFDNPDNYMGHFKDTGKEIFEQMKGKIDVFVMGSGTGATLKGVAMFLKQPNKAPDCQVVLADPTGSSIYNYVKFGTLFTSEEREGHKLRKIDRTIVEGIGLNWLCKNTKDSQIDSAEKATDAEAINMADYILRHEGILIGSSTAVNLVAVVKHCRRNNLQGKKVVTVQCDDGYRHISKFYNQEKREAYGWKAPSCIDKLDFVSLE